MAHAQLDRALGEVVPIADRPGPGQWRFKLPGAPDGVARGRVHEGWLRLERAAEGFSPDEWGLLEINADLPLPIRCVLEPRTQRPSLCADVSVHDITTCRMRIREAYESLEAADCVRRQESSASREDGLAGGYQSQTDSGCASARPLIEACGWPVTERDEGLVVPIGGLAALTGSATVRKEAERGLCIASTLDIDAGGDPDTERGAVARCLLVITGVVRGVRATARRVSGQTTVGLECGLRSDPTEEEMQSALSALSVAWHRCAREVRALRDPRVADVYRRLCAPRALVATD